MKGLGEEGEAKKGSSMNDWIVVSSGSDLTFGCSANMSDLTLGARPSGRSSGPGIKDSVFIGDVEVPIVFVELLETTELLSFSWPPH